VLKKAGESGEKQTNLQRSHELLDGALVVLEPPNLVSKKKLFFF
jgi:hypothetical protein